MGEIFSTCLMILGGVALLLVVAVIAGYLWLRFQVRRAQGQLAGAARHILDLQRALYSDAHEYRTVDAATEFPEADLEYYDTMREWFLERGYRHLGDIEDLTLTRAMPEMRAFLRIMLSSDGATQVAIYDVKPPAEAPEQAGRSFRSVNAVIELSDGTFVSVDNNVGVDMTPDIPAVTRIRLSRETPTEEILRVAHEAAGARSTEDPAVRPVIVATLDEVIASQRREHEAKQAHFASIGYMDPATLLGYAGDDDQRETAELIGSELEKLKRADARERSPDEGVGA